MKKYINEKGYALLVVLLTISIIFSVSAVLATKTITSAKQINSTDEYVRLIDLAEMGTMYAKIGVEESLKESITQNLNDPSIVEDIDNNGKVTEEETSKYMDTVVDKAADNVVKEISGSITIDSTNNYQVELEKLTADKSGASFSIKSIGNDGENSYPIQYSIEATITGGEVSTSVEAVSCDTDSVKVNLDDSVYTAPSDFSTARGEITDYNLDYTNATENTLNTQTIDTCTSYENSLTVNNGERVDFNGSTKVSGSGADFKNGSMVTVNGNFYSQNDVKFNNSSTGIFRDFTSMMKLDMKNSSNVMVDDNLDIYDSLLMDTDSHLVVAKSLLTQNFNNGNNYKVDVGGNYFATSNLDVNGDVIVRGDVIASNGKISDGQMLVGGNYDGRLNVNGGNIVINGDLDASELSLDKGSMIVYGEFNPVGNFNFNGGYGVVYGTIKDKNKIQSNKLKQFDDPNKSDFEKGYIYEYIGIPVSPPALPEMPEIPGGSSSGDTGGISSNSEIEFNQKDVTYN